MRNVEFKPEPPLRADASGVIRIGTSRVTLETVFAAFDQGASAEEIVFRFPSLKLPEVYRTLAYCLEHLADVEGYLKLQGRRAAEDKAKVRSAENVSATWRRIQAQKRGAA